MWHWKKNPEYEQKLVSGANNGVIKAMDFNTNFDGCKDRNVN